MLRFALLVCFGCASIGTPQVNSPFAPTPYSADEIRDACPTGTRLVFDVVESGENSVQQMDFVHTDTQGARVVSRTLDAEAEAGESSATWEELRDHARFPREQTEIEDGELEVPAGRFAITRYLVHSEDGSESAFYFAKDPTYAGPPVHMEVRSSAGDTVYQMSLRERTRFE